MIHFEKHTLPNGLRLIIHPDPSTTLATLNILYNVGARDEQPTHTGFAHLFEHLMFGGSQHIPNYDGVAQSIGAENNAFTSNDITNYYLTFPSNNLETALWLEADRMLQLDFSQKSLEVQQGVVIEEFKQRYLNQPYGDAWLHLRPLAYKKHPYKWATIGKNIKQIQNATLTDVESFFYTHYRPNNAIVVVAGNVQPAEVLQLVQKWFGTIPEGNPRPAATHKNLPTEPAQRAARRKIISAPVPCAMLYKAYHICPRTHADFYASDLLSDVLGRGKASRLYQALVKNQPIFASINAYISGDIDAGLLIIQGQIANGTTTAQAEAALETELQMLYKNITPNELQKTKNQAEAATTFNEATALNVAIQLAYHELLGDANGINTELKHYQNVEITHLKKLAKRIFAPHNCSTLIYEPVA
jgi:predicted Zn-dependent peptidase